METLKVIKLKNFENIEHIQLNKHYVGKVLPNKLIALNKDTRVKAVNKEDLEVDKEVAVLITKMSPPSTVEVKVLNQDFEVIDEDRKDISSLSIEDVGKRFSFYCKVEEINQTSGPTLFTLFDGSGAITSKSFAGPGKRAFPDLKENLAIKASVLIGERDGNIECSLESFERLEENRENQLLTKIQEKLDEKAAPNSANFLIKSEILEKLRPNMVGVAREVKKAILESRPIIVRHHADCDGYCGAIALERAIIPLIIKQHKSDSAQWRYYKRAPSKAPFYEYVDVIKDLTYAIQDMARFGLKEPLVVLVDNGSTEEDLLAIKKIKIYDARVVVVDHHYPGVVKNNKSLVDGFLDSHVNPYLVGGNSTLTAGMLATEVARFINKDVENIEFLPALAGVGDRSRCEEFDSYLDLAKTKGFSLEYLKDISSCIDFEAYYLKFIESRGLVDDLLGCDLKKQKQLISLMIPDIIERNRLQLDVAKHYAVEEDLEKLIIIKLEILKSAFEREYPSPGKIAGMLHDFKEKELDKPIITLGIGNNFITIRVSDSVENFNINFLVQEVRTKLPYSFAQGGGHEHAGTIKFVESAKNEVLGYVEGYIRKC